LRRGGATDKQATEAEAGLGGHRNERAEEVETMRWIGVTEGELKAQRSERKRKRK
jgi:hypothetical protein